MFRAQNELGHALGPAEARMDRGCSDLPRVPGLSAPQLSLPASLCLASQRDHSGLQSQTEVEL